MLISSASATFTLKNILKILIKQNQKHNSVPKCSFYKLTVKEQIGLGQNQHLYNIQPPKKYCDVYKWW